MRLGDSVDVDIGSPWLDCTGEEEEEQLQVEEDVAGGAILIEDCDAGEL